MKTLFYRFPRAHENHRRNNYVTNLGVSDYDPLKVLLASRLSKLVLCNLIRLSQLAILKVARRKQKTTHKRLGRHKEKKRKIVQLFRRLADHTRCCYDRAAHKSNRQVMLETSILTIWSRYMTFNLEMLAAMRR